MRQAQRIFGGLVAFLALAATTQSFGVEILTNGTLDESVGPLNWTSSETVTGSMTPISLAEHLGGVHNSVNDTAVGGLGIFIKPWTGNVGSFDHANKKINYVLTQTVSGVSSGFNYTLTGDARMENGYSGAVAELDPGSQSAREHEADFNSDQTVDGADFLTWQRNTPFFGAPTKVEGDANGDAFVDAADLKIWKAGYGFTTPVGPVASPTQTKFQMEFLNSSDVVLATHTLDLRADTTVYDDWQSHTLTSAAVAPAGTNKIRVTAAALDMVDNFGAQALSFDNFKLVRVGQTVDRLANGNLNTPGAPIGWTLTELPVGTDNSGFIGFAHHSTPESPTGQGLWIRAFEGGDFFLQQTRPAVPAGSYTFSAWSLFETNYLGGELDFSNMFTHPEIDTFLKLEFLDGASAVLSTATLDVAASRLALSGNVAANDTTWRQHVLSNVIAPAGSVSVRITVGATGMPVNFGPPTQSVFFDDFSLQGPASIGAVPEPATLTGLAVAALAGFASRRRRSV
jgi:hypothetical protein